MKSFFCVIQLAIRCWLVAILGRATLKLDKICSMRSNPFRPLSEFREFCLPPSSPAMLRPALFPVSNGVDSAFLNFWPGISACNPKIPAISGRNWFIAPFSRSTLSMARASCVGCRGVMVPPALASNGSWNVSSSAILLRFLTVVLTFLATRTGKGFSALVMSKGQTVEVDNGIRDGAANAGRRSWWDVKGVVVARKRFFVVDSGRGPAFESYNGNLRVTKTTWVTFRPLICNVFFGTRVHYSYVEWVGLLRESPSVQTLFVPGA